MNYNNIQIFLVCSLSNRFANICSESRGNVKKDLRVIKTKASLQITLIELLQEKTLDKISISELCKKANVNRGTFYLHYNDVAELFEEYFHDMTEDLRKAYYEPYLLTHFKIENLSADMVRIFHHVEKYKQFYKIVFNRKTPMMYYYRLFDIIRNYLIDSISEVNSENIEFAASYQANAIIGLVIQWVQHDFMESPEQMNKMLLHLTKVMKH